MEFTTIGSIMDAGTRGRILQTRHSGLSATFRARRHTALRNRSLANRNVRLRLVATIAALLLALGVAGAALGEPNRTHLVVLATSDLHGHIYPIDYFTNKADEGGLAQVHTYVEQVRSENPHVLLVDNGDVLEGGNSVLPYHYTFDADAPNPMIKVMSLIGYDSMTLGNHEFNYGLKTLGKAIDEARFPVVSANIVRENGSSFIQPYTIKDFGDFKVGVLGITTPKVPTWEKPENIEGLVFTNPVETALRHVPEMRALGADVVLIVGHTGWERKPKDSGKLAAWGSPDNWVDTGQLEENWALRLANNVPGVDVIVAGHDHIAVPMVSKMGDILLTDVIITQPGQWGDYVSRIDIELERGAEGRWQVAAKSSMVVPMAGVQPSSEVIEAAKYYHDQTVDFFKRPVAQATGDMPGGFQARFYDNGLVEMINKAQLWATGADISIAALFTDTSKISKGPITVQDVYGLYVYPNTLYTIKINGQQLREAIEASANYFHTYTDQTSLADLVNTSMRGYNYDIYQGVEYAIDISKPIGQRIVELKFKGEDVRPDQEFVVALNNYRAGGGGGYTMFRNAELLSESTTEVREIMVDYLRSVGQFGPESVDNNWRILPAAVDEMAHPR